MIEKGIVSKEAQCTFNMFTRVYDWGEHIEKVVIHSNLYELCTKRKYGDLGNDKNLAIYENGEYEVVEFYDDLFKSEIICEYTFDEFSKMCENAPLIFPNVLNESEHYYVFRNSDELKIVRKSDNEILSDLGIHSGEVKDVYIDPSERYCVVVGDSMHMYEIQG